MKYIVKMEDTDKFKQIIKEIEAASVFDAIDIAAGMIDNPNETVLVEAYPVLTE